MVDIARLNAPYGVEINGLDISGEITAAKQEMIKNLLAEHSVVVFRNQKISQHDLARFTRMLGPPRVPLKDEYAIPGLDGLHILSNIKENGRLIGIPDAGHNWHSDGAYMATPDSYTLLYGVEVPHDEADNPLGSTRFSSTRMAYNALSPEMKAKLEPLKAVFTTQLKYDRKIRAGILQRGELTTEQRSRAPDQIHPVIRVHPATGDKCIFVNDAHTTRILGVSEEESEELMAFLRAFILRDEFRYDHQWRVNDLLVWDNPSTQHNGTHDYQLPQRRLMWRTSCIGSKPYGVEQAA